MGILQNSLTNSHKYLKSVINEGDCVIDATVGNGHDTLFLAQEVGSNGLVYGFDIQKEAINKTTARLTEYNLAEKVVLINKSHEYMNHYLKDLTMPIKAVIFNLGYLPGGDHSISTDYHIVITACENIFPLLSKNGLISLVVYHGGDTGCLEKEKLLEWASKLNHKKYAVLKHAYINQVNQPPILICIEKLY